MEDPHNSPSHSPDIKNVLPDVVHSQQIPALGTDITNESSEALGSNVAQDIENETAQANEIIVTENSDAESISEHLPSRMDFSLSTSDTVAKTNEPQEMLSTITQEEKSQHSLHIQYPHSSSSDHQSGVEPDYNSPSWPADANPISDLNHISAESPVNLPLSSEPSKAPTECKSDSLTPQFSIHESEKESLKMEFVDSLNEKSIEQSQDSLDRDPSIERDESLKNDSSSGSEELIKLDIRGSGVPRFPFQTEKIIFGPVPECSSFIEPNLEQMPMFPNLLSPFLVGAGESVLAGGLFNAQEISQDLTPEKLFEPLQEKYFEPSPEHSFEQKDLLVEEVLVDDTKVEDPVKDDEVLSTPPQPKSLAPEETGSFSTMNTDYKTICEEYHGKLVHLEEAISKRDELIEELTISLQRSVKEQDTLRKENEHLGSEVQNLQHMVCEKSQSEHDTIKAQLSDLVKYESMLRDDSTKFFSAVSSESSAKSSIAERDKDQEELTVNYSRSDLKSSEASDDFQMEFETKLSDTIGQFDDIIEENSRNKLRESLLQIFCDEVGRLRMEYDAESKELETQMQQERQTSFVEIRKLRELLASVKTGNPDLDHLRQELANKHEKEMENLRMYFEKKCSDMERSYSEEVWRGRCAAGGGGGAGGGGEGDGAGEGDGKRRARSADLGLLSLESTQSEQAAKQIRLKYEQQLEEVKVAHQAHVTDLQTKQAGAIASLEDQITQLKAHVQTAENTESNMSLYQQDIDLELEKKTALTEVVESVRQEVIQQLQEQIQVLLSDPDAELSSWPLELVALRDKIYDARPKDEKEFSSLREELTTCERDKWKQRRNLSFDQNRQIEEVTKERDGLKRVAATLQHVVSQLVAYCVAAEDELNRTVLGELLTRVLPHADPVLQEEESTQSTQNLSVSLNTSLSRSSKHVHFAPDLRDILAELDEEDLLGYLEQQRDLSLEIKRELENSLLRLRNEAQELLELSSKVGINRPEQKMLESGQVEITELVEVYDSRRRSCDNCEDVRKIMEEAMAECLHRESLLRTDLEAAMLKISHLMTSADKVQSTDLIAEGYGLASPPSLPLSMPVRCERSPEHSPRSEHSQLQHEIDSLQKERDDLQQQLEAANRQLRSTRQFVDEQATEREAERDEFAKRLADLREENARLATRLQSNARILNEVEQLESQTREMNQLITDLEERKLATDEELKATQEKISLLRDIIANLETQLEQKNTRETEILSQLEEMKRTIDERDSKMRTLLGELESLKSERADCSDVTCAKCSQDDDETDLLEKIKEEARHIELSLERRTRRLERTHEETSAPHSAEPTEELSVREHKYHSQETPPSPPASPVGSGARGALLAPLWRSLEAHSRAEEMALKRIADLEMQRDLLKDVAQEVRAERDVLQARMSEQALKISSLGARLQQQRHNAEALAHDATSQLTVELHDSRAEVQRLKEEVETKDKQLARLKQSIDEKDKLSEQHETLYGNSCNPKDKVVILERELSSAQTRIAQLESLARTLEHDKEEMQVLLRDAQRMVAEKETQLHELLALKLDEEQKSDQRSEVIEGKTSARTLSDIVSISDFDEQDLQMRRAELKAQNLNLTGAPYVTDTRDKSLNRTLPPETHQANMSSLNVDLTDHFDLHFTPRADSLPIQLTSTQNKDLMKRYKRNVNETTVIGTIDKFGDSAKHSTAVKILDNCSMYPNRDISDSKNLSVEPKKIDFSLEPSKDNKTQDDHEFTSLRELGITLDIKQENFPDILTQLKHEIKKSKSELNVCKSELKTAEEQLCEFPALKQEVEELKNLLENTMATMDTDKKFYNNQLDQFTSNKKILEQRLTDLTQEVSEKSQDLHLLKEDILRRENMILELAKEKRNLTNKMSELEMKIDELESKNNALAKYESESLKMREKVSELNKLEQLVSEKNQQIDSLNQHLDRFDDLQRCLNDKTEEFDNLKEAFEEKSNELFQMQDAVEALNRDLANVHEDNKKLNLTNKELKLKLTKLEKEQENQSLKLQSSESELERVNSLNSELSSKIEDLKQMADKLKDKETEIEILNEDINAFHEEIASLKEQLKLGSRSPSPRNKNCDEKKRPLDRQASNDKKQLVKIRKQISLMQHELDFNKKDLNDKAFELAKSKLDATELKSALSQAYKISAERESATKRLEDQTRALQEDMAHLRREKGQLEQQMNILLERLREESNMGEVKQKLREKSEQCQALEREVASLKDLVDNRVAESPRATSSAPASALVPRGARSPTAELERALRDQLNYSHRLDDDIMEQILSASSDNEEIPRLALNSSKSSSSLYSPPADVSRLQADKERLQLQLDHLQARLHDKDQLIAELNRIRDTLVQDWQTAKLKYETERDNSGRLQLLLDTQKETSESLQHQDTKMIAILKKRLESAMRGELESTQACQQYKVRLAHLERELRQLAPSSHTAELESIDRLKGEVSILKSKLDVERSRYSDLQATLEQNRDQYSRELDQRTAQCQELRRELAEVRRLKHETGVELVRAKELLHIQENTISALEKKIEKLSAALPKQKIVNDALTEIESHKSELSRELTSLRQCLLESRAGAGGGAEVAARDALVSRLTAEKEALAAQLHDQAAEGNHAAIRYLHSRCIRLESCRKALVWQKRYLQRVLAGYRELEAKLGLPSSDVAHAGKRRFRCVVSCVIAVARLSFLVRRRQQIRSLSAALTRVPTSYRDVNTPTSQYLSASPLAPASFPATPAPSTPAGHQAPSLARRVLKHELRLNLPRSPSLGDPHRSPCHYSTPTRSPHGDPFTLNLPRGQATAYLNKLELVSRCLTQTMEAARDAQ